MKNILLTICLCLLGLASYAQDGVVKGKILDSSGSPLPGVNIVVKERPMELLPILMEITN